MKVKPEETKPEHKPTNEPTIATSEQIADLAPTEADAEEVKGGGLTVWNEQLVLGGRGFAPKTPQG